VGTGEPEVWPARAAAKTRVLRADDQARGRGGVFMPDALERKHPRAGAS
jgi:hypothetical protein